MIETKKLSDLTLKRITKSDIFFPSIFQVVFLGLDYRIGKVSSSVLELYYLDGKQVFSTLKIGFLIATLIEKNIKYYLENL